MVELSYAVQTQVSRADGELLWPVYNEVFCDQPSVGEWLDETWDRHSGRDGFRLVTAAVDERVVGFGWGYLGERGQWWTDRISETLAQPVVDAWVGGHFEIVSLGVVPAARRHGVGRRLLHHLQEAAPSDRLLLQTADDEDDPARRLYESEGWGVLGPGASDGTVVMGWRRAEAPERRGSRTRG
jgi:ribosomal protein S18 acetylase RimI-like enzyme